MNKIKIYIFLLVLLFALLFVIEATKPKAIDWTPSFNRNHKKPWGTYILFRELKKLFAGSHIEAVRTTPYERLKYLYPDTDSGKDDEDTIYEYQAYLFINNYVNIDKESVDKLLAFVRRGNTVFISATGIGHYLQDTLHFTIKSKYYYSVKDTLKKELYFTNPALRQEKFLFNKGFETTYLDSLDLVTSTVLGYHKLKGEEYVNFAKINYGKGSFFIHLQPYAFTNYHLLKDNHSLYASNALSYIDANTILWDTKIKTGTDISKSSLRFILSHPPLKWAWRLMWLGMILFVIFRAKRKQRIVPVIEKLPNTSVAFAKTIGNMYFNNGEPRDIIIKKINFFLEDIRNRYLIDTQHLNEEFIKRLHRKTGIPKEEIERMVKYIVHLKRKSNPGENNLIILNKFINQFYQKSNPNGRKFSK